MKSIVSFQKIVSYISIVVFFLVTFLFFTSYTTLKKERRTKWRLYRCAEFLASEKTSVDEYPYSLRCYVDKGFRIKDGWGNVFKYECIDDGKDYILFSVGKDGIPYTDDDMHAKKHQPRYY
ncbi:hypothetical protein [uncultured Kordia sp.]|uniref:hypothetical protein n=1 Tax=uncultured Kordia sp. TaxID=507699 RepID=UPI00261684B6|nr:hypothetical protein [uncultured Kordia sp.]